MPWYKRQKDYNDYKKEADRAFKEWQSANKRDKNTWNNDSVKSYRAAEEYREATKHMEEEKNKMDPNSEAYEQAGLDIDRQKGRQWEMDNDNRIYCNQQDGIQKLEAENKQLYDEMYKESMQAKPDSRHYDELREKYVKNLEAQDRMHAGARGNGEKFEDTRNAQRQNLLTSDINMRDRFEGKDREKSGKYADKINEDEKEILRKDGERKVDAMRDRGASEEEIKRQEEDNERTVKQYTR